MNQYRLIQEILEMREWADDYDNRHGPRERILILCNRIEQLQKDHFKLNAEFLKIIESTHECALIALRDLLANGLIVPGPIGPVTQTCANKFMVVKIIEDAFNNFPKRMAVNASGEWGNAEDIINELEPDAAKRKIPNPDFIDP